VKVTRTILADVPAQLAGICKTAGYIRADIWRRYGALGNVGVSASAVRTEIIEKKIYDSLRIDGTIRAETTKDIVNDILTYKAAAKLKVRQAIAKRTTDENERKRLYTLLKTDEWLSDSFLHRQMRKHFRHGRSEVANQFIGADCATPSKFVICWTPDGAQTETTQATGGTGQAIRIAVACGVPVFNLARTDTLERLKAFVAP
jgi:hypothetical protein